METQWWGVGDYEEGKKTERVQDNLKLHGGGDDDDKKAD